MDGYGKDTQLSLHAWLLGFDPILPTASKYCMLSTASFTNDGTGMIEVVTGLNYLRQQMVDGAGNSWLAPVNVEVLPTPSNQYYCQSSNADDVSFGPSTGEWGTIRAFGIMRSSVITPGEDGDIYFGGDLDTPKLIETDTVAVFAAGNLKLQTLNTV